MNPNMDIADLTPEEAWAEANRLEALARDLRDYAQTYRNPGLLPDEEGYISEHEIALGDLD